MYQGTSVAVDFSANHAAGTAFERYAADRNQFSGSLGAYSVYAVFGTTGANLSVTHNFRVSPFTGASAVANISLRDLGLNATDADTSITTADDLEVDVSSNAGGRQLEATLYNSSDNKVSSQIVTTDSSTGDVTVSFSVASDDTGTYYVVVQDVVSGVQNTTTDIAVEEAAVGDGSFALNTFTTISGGVTEIEVDLSANDTATLTVCSAGAGYLVNVTVEDGDNDGEVVQQWNTYAAGNTTSFSADFSVNDSDDILVTQLDGSTYQPNSPVDTGTYNLDVRAGTSLSATAQGVCVVEERFSPNLTSWTMPEERLPTKVSDLLNVSANGNLTADERIARGEWLVLSRDAQGRSRQSRLVHR